MSRRTLLSPAGRHTRPAGLHAHTRPRPGPYDCPVIRVTTVRAWSTAGPANGPGRLARLGALLLLLAAGVAVTILLLPLVVLAVVGVLLFIVVVRLVAWITTLGGRRTDVPTRDDEGRRNVRVIIRESSAD